jgi:transcriptional regulator with XRE-family HTH domain
MGYGGKTWEQAQARELQAKSWTLADIATELGVAKSSVSRWVRDVDFVPNPRRTAPNRPPNKLQRAKAAEIERCRAEGIARVGVLSEREFLAAGIGLYAGDGAKGDNEVAFANSNPELVRFFCAWFRRFFPVDEKRMRISLYLHEDLDAESAEQFWAELTGVPRHQFFKTYRAASSGTVRRNRHVNGCCHVRYGSVAAIREIKGMMEGLALVPSSPILPG